jgi:hypothetical protein
VNNLEKERTILTLENMQLRQDVEKSMPMRPELEKLRTEKLSWEVKFAEMQKEYKDILNDKLAYEESLKRLNEQIQEIMQMTEDY